MQRISKRTHQICWVLTTCLKSSRTIWRTDREMVGVVDIYPFGKRRHGKYPTLGSQAMAQASSHLHLPEIFQQVMFHGLHLMSQTLDWWLDRNFRAQIPWLISSLFFPFRDGSKTTNTIAGWTSMNKSYFQGETSFDPSPLNVAIDWGIWHFEPWPFPCF